RRVRLCRSAGDLYGLGRHAICRDHVGRRRLARGHRQCRAGPAAAQWCARVYRRGAGSPRLYRRRQQPAGVLAAKTEPGGGRAAEREAAVIAPSSPRFPAKAGIHASAVRKFAGASTSARQGADKIERRLLPPRLVAMAALALIGWVRPAVADELQVCADPNNLPFSDTQEQGFENKLATLVAAELGKTVSYTWWAQRRGFIRNTLKAKDCDVMIGVPVGYDLVEATRPYYRSTYVFVSRSDRDLDISSLTDERLRQLSIGVHLIGDDGSNTPPADALAHRGITGNVKGYMIYGDYRRPSPR